MATHSSVLAWRIPGTEEPSGLPSMGSHRVGHDWSDLAVAVPCCGATKPSCHNYAACALWSTCAAAKTQCNQNFKNNIKSTYKKKKERCLPAMSSGCYPCLLRLKWTFLDHSPLPWPFYFPSLQLSIPFLTQTLKELSLPLWLSFLLLLSPLWETSRCFSPCVLVRFHPIQI